MKKLHSNGVPKLHTITNILRFPQCFRGAMVGIHFAVLMGMEVGMKHNQHFPWTICPVCVAADVVASGLPTMLAPLTDEQVANLGTGYEMDEWEER